MNEKVLKLLHGDELLYPHELEKRYPHILSKIMSLWYTPQAEAYFLDLMVDKRGGRQGFPPKVATEIFHLSQVHERNSAVSKPSNKNAWEIAGVRDLQTRDSHATEVMNFIFTPQEFFKSLEAGDLNAVNRYLDRDGDLDIRDEQGWYPLMFSASSGHEEITRLLIQKGANVDAKDHAGYIALHWAAFNGHDKIIALLIENGSDPNAYSNFGWTPLMQATTRGHLAATKQLLKGGADINLASKDGRTALHKATANGHVEIVKLLLALGADRNMQHQDGSTALSIATKNKNDALIALLNS